MSGSKPAANKIATGLKVASLSVQDRPQLRDAIVIHSQTIAAARKFHSLYIEHRQGSRGTTSHDEQDLLRAMLVFACSGLDAVVKQLVQDAIEQLIEKDDGAQREFQKFVERRLKRGPTGEDKEKVTGVLVPVDSTLLAGLLINKNPRRALIDQLIENLTAESLQSRDQLLRVAAHFALTKDQVLFDEPSVQAGFKARNEIIHEMDVDLSGHKKRRQRSHDTMVTLSEAMLSTASKFISAVNSKLAPS